MNRRALSLLALVAAALPLTAQSYGDSPAFGGSRVFSEGLDPLGNSARFDRVPAGWYLGWEAGDWKPRGFRSDSDALGQALAVGDAATAASLTNSLQNDPMPLRTSDIGLEYAGTGGVRFALGHELRTGVEMLPGNTIAARRVEVDRMVTGAGSSDGQTAYGITFRLERVRVGVEQTVGVAPDPALAFAGTSRSTLSVTSDAGFTTTLTEGVRFGLMVNRLLPRHFWDVYEQPQARAGLELDLGTLGRLSVEGDLNKAARLPLPEKQKTLSTSLRILATPTVTLVVGAERRTVDGVSATLVGTTVQIATAPLRLAFGFQFGDDRPQKALGLRIGG